MSMNEKEPNQLTRSVLKRTYANCLNEILIRNVNIRDITDDGESDTDNPHAIFRLNKSKNPALKADPMISIEIKVRTPMDTYLLTLCLRNHAPYPQLHRNGAEKYLLWHGR